MAAVTPFAFRQMIADALLAAELMYAQVGSGLAELLDALADSIAMASAFEIDRLHSFLILFFRQLLVEHTILFLIETNASETIGAAKAVLAERAVAAVLAILTVVGHVTIHAIDTLRAPLTAHAEREPAAAHALPRISGVVHILGVEDPEAVVAILRFDGRVGVIAVLGSHLL